MDAWCLDHKTPQLESDEWKNAGLWLCWTLVPSNVGPWMVGTFRLRAFWSKHEASPRARTSCGRFHTEHWLSSESSGSKDSAHLKVTTNFPMSLSPKHGRLLWFVAVSVVYTIWAMPKRQGLAFTRPISPRTWGQLYLGDLLSSKSSFVVFTFKLANCFEVLLWSQTQL